jgi:hypothetical protein
MNKQLIFREKISWNLNDFHQPSNTPPTPPLYATNKKWSLPKWKEKVIDVFVIVFYTKLPPDPNLDENKTIK